jgi:integrase
MRRAGDSVHGRRLRGLIVVLWRAGLRIHGPTRGRPWSAAAARFELRQVAREAGVRRRFAPHQLRHAHAVEMAREGVPLIVIQRQLGHYVGDPLPAHATRQGPDRRSPHIMLDPCG